MTTFIGIDPGLDGGFAFISGSFVEVAPTPVTPSGRRQYIEQGMRILIEAANGADVPSVGTAAAIEEQRPMPRQGVRSMFSIGLGYGLWRGLLAGAGIPYDIVTPQRWRRDLGLATGADKGASVALASRLFPQLAEQFTGPRGGMRDGLAEAVLLAEWRRRQG